jgi:hypothetical protein
VTIKSARALRLGRGVVAGIVAVGYINVFRERPVMSPLGMGFVIFVLMICGAVVGISLNPLVERHHLGQNYKELLRSTRSVIVQLTAVTLGLLVAQSLDAFEKKSGVLRNQAAHVVALHNVLAEYGPGAKTVEAELRKVVAEEIGQVQVAAKMGRDAPREIALFSMEPLRHFLVALQPANKEQDYLKTAALTLGEKIILLRWEIYEQLDSNIQWPLVGVLVFWLVSIFFSFGVLTPPDGILMAGLFLSALSLAAAMYLLLELDMPYQGLITISGAPLEAAIRQIR